MDKKGQTGIGTMVIFIAMIMVAAITANVLIQTATSMQNQALSTGKQTEQAVSTYGQITGITGTDGTNGELEDFRIEMKLAPGSDGIDLSKALLSAEIQNMSLGLVYSANACENDSATGYASDEANENGTFTVKYLVRGQNSKDGYFVRGDIIELCWGIANGLGEDEDFAVRFVPSVGVPTVVETVSPDVMTSYLVRLFP